MIQRAVFPFFQGAPVLNTIAAKARGLARVMAPEFESLAQRIVDDAAVLAHALMAHGYTVVSGGTDNHIVLVDVLTSRGVTGVVAEKALEESGIIVNKNRIPGDQKSAFVASGIRLGTNSLAARVWAPITQNCSMTRSMWATENPDCVARNTMTSSMSSSRRSTRSIQERCSSGRISRM